MNQYNAQNLAVMNDYAGLSAQALINRANMYTQQFISYGTTPQRALLLAIIEGRDIWRRAPKSRSHWGIH